MSAIQDEEMESLINCGICQKELSDPVMLPCLNSVCSTHITSNDSFYKCDICNRFHSIPDQGFNKDRRAIKLIQIKNSKTETKPEIKLDDYIKMDQINFGKVHCEAKSNCQELENLLKHSTELMLNSHGYINNFFEKLIQEIDLHKEVSLSLINQNHERILNLISTQKNICFENSSAGVDSFKKVIENSKNKLETWYGELKIPDFDCKARWESISEEAREVLNDLRKHNEKFQSDLILNKQYTFSPIVFKNNNFGDFEIDSKETPDSIPVDRKLERKCLS